MPHCLFGGNVLTDEKSGQLFLRSIFNSTHHYVRFCLDILAGRMAFVRKRCGGKFGWLVLVDSSPKLIFGTSRYIKYSRVPSQLACCAHRSTSGYSTLGIPYHHNAVPPPMATATTRDRLISIKGHTISNVTFYAYQLPDMLRLYSYQCDKNLKSSLLGMTSFFGCGLSGSSLVPC
jgi:hypothetical protein